MTFENALRVLNYDKGQLMELAYGKGYQGIDSAIPQGYADFSGLSYGNEDTRLDLFFYVADCRHGCTVEDMRNIIPSYKKALIIADAEIIEYARNLPGNIPDSLYTIHDAIEEALK